MHESIASKHFGDIVPQILIIPHYILRYSEELDLEWLQRLVVASEKPSNTSDADRLSPATNQVCVIQRGDTMNCAYFVASGL